MVNHDFLVVVAAGGQSSRMGVDKLKLFYGSKEQQLRLKELFETITTQIFFSIRKEQDYSFLTDKNVLFDDEEFKGRGPISGLLSANKKFPESSILFLGCDYPFISNEEIDLLISQYKSKKVRSFFTQDYEPLLSFYPNSCFDELKKHFKDGDSSLKRFLIKTSAEKIFCRNPEKIMSIDTQEHYNKIKKSLANLNIK